MTSNISTHAPHAGSDSAIAASMSAFAFDFNPRSPRGERQRGTVSLYYVMPISIRAPLAGSDGFRHKSRLPTGISIRAPLAGSDTVVWVNPDTKNEFQSALPLRGATNRRMNEQMPNIFQSALPLRGATTARSL